MRIVEITALPNGAHRNQNGQLSKIPDGWAMIPEDMVLENFPFGEVIAEEVENESGKKFMTIVNWIPGTPPETDLDLEVKEPATQLDRIEAQVFYTAMMTNTLMEE